MSDKMMNRKTWDHFRNTGMLFLANQLIHAFGWAIVMEFDEVGNFKDVYPARVRFRGFSTEVIENSYKNISQYMLENAEELFNESFE